MQLPCARAPRFPVADRRAGDTASVGMSPPVRSILMAQNMLPACCMCGSADVDKRMRARTWEC